MGVLMAAIKTACVNLLESATVTLTAGTAAAGYPLYRAYDRDIGRMFAGSAAATTTIHADQGAAGAVSVSSLFVPAGHVGLVGETLSLQHSPDNSTWTDGLTPFAPVAGDIIVDVTGGVKRYWAFSVASPAAAPQLAELFLGPVVTWGRSPSRPGGPQESLMNVTVAVSATGRPRYEINGQSLRQRNYTLYNISSAQRVGFEALWAAWAGSKPFFLCDHEGAWIYGRFTAQPGLKETAPGTYSATVSFLEVPA
jgi:hypothetical protein